MNVQNEKRAVSRALAHPEEPMLATVVYSFRKPLGSTAGAGDQSAHQRRVTRNVLEPMIATGLMASSTRPWLETVGILLTALFALAAVVVALWIQWVRVELQKPRLKMVFDPDNDEPFSATFAREYEALWLRFRVVNEWPKADGRGLKECLTRLAQSSVGSLDTATDVEVFLARARRAPESRQQGMVPSRPLKWADVKQGAISLPPGVSRYVDVVRIGAPPKTTGDIRMRLLMFPEHMDDPEDDPEDDRHLLSPGCSLLELVLSARDITATHYTAAIQFDGGGQGDPRFFPARVHLQPGRIEDYDETAAVFRGPKWLGESQ
jgi:hypothetical protein